MFGGICYLKSGNMAFGIWRDHLIVRCGAERHKEYLRKKNVKEFDVTGKPMSGWIMVAPEGIEEDEPFKMDKSQETPTPPRCRQRDRAGERRGRR